jgi:hypothetical protein
MFAGDNSVGRVIFAMLIIYLFQVHDIISCACSTVLNYCIGTMHRLGVVTQRLLREPLREHEL